MRVGIKIIFLGLAVFMASFISAQGIVTQRLLSASAAKLVAEAAHSPCLSQGFHTTVAVVDRVGNLLVVMRDEQAHPVTIEMAQRKARTAVMFRGPSSDFQQNTASDPTRAGQRDVADAIALGGGLPIYFEGEIIGAVASSGANPTADEECARAGVARAEDLL